MAQAQTHSTHQSQSNHSSQSQQTSKNTTLHHGVGIPSKSSNSKSSSNASQLQLPTNEWVCVLCRKICHYRGLGDLFGPYNIDFSSNSETSHTTDKCKSITPKKSKYSLLNHNYAVREIWIHEDCLVWSEGVHLVGKKILKMEDTIKASFNHNCSVCKTKGATIGCAGKRCRRKFHYICGRDANCLLDEANFTLKCDKCLANTAASLSLSMNL